MWGKGLAVQQYHLLETLLEIFTPRDRIPSENTRGFFNQTRVWSTPPAPNALIQGRGDLLKGSSFPVVLGSDKECIG